MELETFGMLNIVLLIVMYAYAAFCLQKIATRLGVSHAWLAWIPVANVFIVLEAARKPLWWFILILIPLVNLVITIMAWAAVAKNLGRTGWHGLFIMIPLVNFVTLGMMAFGTAGAPAAQAAPPTPPQPPAPQA